MPEVVRLFNSTQDEAMLSIAVFIAVCVHPKERQRRDRLMDAYAALCEAHGYEVWRTLRSGLRWRPASQKMPPRRRDQILNRAAYTLLAGRLAAVKLGFLMSYRPQDQTRGQVADRFGKSYLAAGNRVLGLYQRNSADMDKNVTRLVWRETRPVLHLAYALGIEFDRHALTPWQWPILASAFDDPQARITRMVAAAETWRKALTGPSFGGRGDVTIAEQQQIRMTL